MTIINLEANVKNLVTGPGLSLSSSGNDVNLTINNNGLAQILSQILQSSSTVTVNYSSTTGKITFISSGGGGSGSSGPFPLTITDKHIFDSDNKVTVEPNQNVFLLATRNQDWDANQEYYIDFPEGGFTYNLVYVRYSLTNNCRFIYSLSGTSSLYYLDNYNDKVLIAVGVGGDHTYFYGPISLIEPSWNN